MVIYEPVMAAMALAKWLGEEITARKGLPDVEAVRNKIVELGLEEVCAREGLAVFRNRFVITLLIPKSGMIVVDFLSASGELSDALELVAYFDRKIESYVVEIIPANELEFEGNVGVEPVIIDGKTFELKSYPVLGEFREDRGSVYLAVDEKTYAMWRDSEKLNVCPVCGGELRWRGRRAICVDCGLEVRVVEEREEGSR
ncbi:membrane protein [Pyrococcus yayanosii]|uniref:Hypothetical membrane protein n=1 Tax=Pyrococcus yayanosii (strain CH1 / JCM 16557) TaxID=529709 RepID=F8AH79_PYRYC|nr:membrane protein [Pyrococcus yayanosii]AEH25309.1 hypothetical membrane protein [Pyrococcus yayanosii CH1]